jgi:hypothetical protein
VNAFEAKVLELQLRRLRGVQMANKTVPPKKGTKKSVRMQNTFEKNLRGVPGGHWLRMAHTAETGCRTRPENIGVLRSARNANTTQGSYIETVVR